MGLLQSRGCAGFYFCPHSPVLSSPCPLPWQTDTYHCKSWAPLFLGFSQ